ncbi:MAG: VOC family protein [Edaphobacter sp.]|uniref:VOC family protein n=1 Tax=Edaphobacter sp. TaxID=1934404 RepID=UPI00238F3147|nr:VOC family protein [Edaphobacter sp.]MDE1178721.1 VOC family protein [Edaphobacter sp.]
MLSNRSMPSAAIIPELAYPDLDEAIDWMSSVFGFTLRIRIGDHRAQMTFDGGAIIIVEHPRAGAVTPIAHSLMVRVPDVETHYQNAVAQGARIMRPPVTYPYGERQYTAADMIGRTWTFSQSVADVDPREWGGVPGTL